MPDRKETDGKKMIDHYIALDLETTGLDPKKDKIIEVGAVRVRNGKVTDRFQSLIDPGVVLPDQITQLTGITQEELNGAPYPEQVLPKLLDFMGDDVILGHSVMFDYSFLKKEAVNQGLWKTEQHAMGIDTLKLARVLLPELPSRRLADLCVHYQIEHQAHRALGDAESTAELYRCLVREFYDREDTDGNEVQTGKPSLTDRDREHLFEPFPLIYKIKRQSPARPHQKEKLYSLLAEHKIVPDYDVERLTRNEASRLIDQICFTYGRSSQGSNG